FDPRRGGGRAEDRVARVGESIDDAETQRQLGSDNREIDLLALDEAQQEIDVGRVDGDGVRQRADTGVSGRAHEGTGLEIAGQTRDECVLARTAPDNQNPHRWNGLGISLTLTGIAPRIRAYP